MLTVFKHHRLLCRSFSYYSTERFLSTDARPSTTRRSKMVVRITSHRRLPKKSYIDQADRRLPRDLQISEINQIALVPPISKDDFEDFRFQMPYPKDIVKYLDKFVVGQELAKQTLAVGVYQHYKRLQNNTETQNRELIRDAVSSSMKKTGKKQKTEDEEYDELLGDPPLLKRKTVFERMEEEVPLTMEKSNIVLLGPSGSGKTYLTQCLARLLDVPIAMCDCTTLTQAGYVGEDVETLIQKLLINAHGNIERAQHGIVFLDEFDKIHSSSDPLHSVGNRDVSGRGVQQALLKLVEGTVARVKIPGPIMSKVDVDTTNILFIASGAFSNLEQIIARRIDKRVLGFGAAFTNVVEDLSDSDETIAAKKRNELFQLADSSDLIQFGMVPELVGRFPILVPFHTLDEKMLIRVFHEPHNNLILQAQQFFAMDNIKLKLTRGAINEMARIAVQRKTGARALRPKFLSPVVFLYRPLMTIRNPDRCCQFYLSISILEKVLLQAKFECPGSGTHTVVITGATVRGESNYVTLSSRTVNANGKGGIVISSRSAGR
ncbi:hypothetical protein Angca_005949 [Angiostrongylus cantonensis]|nr:hypothetical protein Angca_005949 [Angiostrongylus cantonensis]